MGPSNEVVVAFHLHRRAGRPPLIYHQGVKARQQGVRISKLWFGVLPVATIYDRSKKDMVALEKALMTIMTWPATRARHLWSYSVARSQRVRVRQRHSPAFQRGLRLRLAACEAIHPDPCSIPIAGTSPSANCTYPICMGRASSSRRYLRARAACIWRGAARRSSRLPSRNIRIEAQSLERERQHRSSYRSERHGGYLRNTIVSATSGH